MKCAHEYPQIPYCLFTGAGGATDLTPGQLSRQFKQGARLASSAIQVRPSKSKHLAWVQRQKTHATDEIARFREWVALEVELDEPTRKDSTGFWRGI